MKMIWILFEKIIYELWMKAARNLIDRTCLLNDLLLIVVQLYWNTTIAHKVLCISVTAVSNSVWLYDLLHLNNWLQFSLWLGASYLWPTPFFHFNLNKLLLSYSHLFFTHFLTFTNIWTGQNAFRKGIYKKKIFFFRGWTKLIGAEKLSST